MSINAKKSAVRNQLTYTNNQLTNYLDVSIKGGGGGGGSGGVANATNIAGGSAGVVPYQTAPDITAFTAVGTVGQILQSNGTFAPTWVNPAAATNVLITSDNTAGTYFIPFTKTSGTGNKPLFIDDATTPLTYNPNTSNLITGTINAIPIGQGAGSLSTNTLVGIGALSSASLTVGNNTAVGNNALQNNTTGTNNTAVGYTALQSNTTGGAVTAFGSLCLNANTTGTNNTGVGASTLRLNTTGGFNSALGLSSLRINTTGNSNCAFGAETLQNNTTGSNNTGFGLRALQNSTTGNNNTCIGSNAGTATSPSGNITTASNQICIGDNDVTNAFIKVDWTVTSDLRDKTNLKPIIHGLDFVNQLKPTEFQFRKERGSEEIQEGGRIHYGFIAQDILALEGDKPVIIGNNDMEHLNYTQSNLIPVLVNAIKELTARVQALEAGK